METFYLLRNVPDIQKKPSTSELIDWLQALVVGVNPNRIKRFALFGGLAQEKRRFGHLAPAAAGQRQHQKPRSFRTF